ncbi:leukemia inhibitory factor receptor-like [Chanos chanos]|uniref:Leukemia inhibitory factor receptor-like n=1 Tax=Chanos chanos TaxID=29144 RepID=A0A6J2UXV7_CHACN|nr:leukemia inhibitory factor receptor [Chanos chanos]
MTTAVKTAFKSENFHLKLPAPSRKFLGNRNRAPYVRRYERTEVSKRFLPPEAQNMTLYPDYNTWMIKVTWEDSIPPEIQSKNLIYEIEVIRTELNERVHNDTVEVLLNQVGPHQWEWTSPLPLNCTSHTVRIRSQYQHPVSKWSKWTEMILKGEDADIKPDSQTKIFPRNQSFKVGSNITSCCILGSEETSEPHDSFVIKISNRTYATKPYTLPKPTYETGYDLLCGDKGATIKFGTPPQDYGFNCTTRDLKTVECVWNSGPNTGLNDATKYSINGSPCVCAKTGHCKDCSCSLNESINQGERTWILTAKNSLGQKTIKYTADPKDRVWLHAPVLQPVTASARNANISWPWNGKQYKSFLLECEMELQDSEHSETRNFTGPGLQSVNLVDLQPFTDYVVKVRCRYRWKWSDWSTPRSFSTTEDIPEALDVWAHRSSGETVIAWKLRKSHGKILHYTVTMDNTTPEEINDAQMNCITRRNVTDIITVSAANSAGCSPPSSVRIAEPESAEPVLTSTGHEGGFNFSWPRSPDAECGYVIDWFQTHRNECSIDWMKIPLENTSARIQSDNLMAGERYTLSVYACTQRGPKLLKRSYGYVEEQAPTGKVQNLTTRQEGSKVVLSWDPVPLVHRRGIIKGYIVSYSRSESKNPTCFNIQNPAARNWTQELDADSYQFLVKAYTSAGEGLEASIGISVAPQPPQIITETAIALVATVLVLTIITTLCYRKRTWLKNRLYPDIPQPKFRDEWPEKEPLHCQLMKVDVNAECTVPSVKPQELPAELTSVNEYQREEKQPLSDPQKQVPCYLNLENTEPLVTITEYTVISTSAAQHLENPTYQSTAPLDLEAVSSIPGYSPQMTSVPEAPLQIDLTYQPIKDSQAYQPQSNWSVDVSNIAYQPSLPGSPTSVSSTHCLLQESRGHLSAALAYLPYPWVETHLTFSLPASWIHWGEASETGWLYVVGGDETTTVTQLALDCQTGTVPSYAWPKGLKESAAMVTALGLHLRGYRVNNQWESQLGLADQGGHREPSMPSAT